MIGEIWQSALLTVIPGLGQVLGTAIVGGVSLVCALAGAIAVCCGLWICAEIRERTEVVSRERRRLEQEVDDLRVQISMADHGRVARGEAA